MLTIIVNMKVLIASVGETPEAILKPLRSGGFSKAVFIHPNGILAKRCLKEVLRFCKKERIEADSIEVDPYDVLYNLNLCKKIMKNNAKSSIFVNVTGGRKTLSMALAMAAFISSEKSVKASYYTEESGREILLPQFKVKDATLSEAKLEIMACLPQEEWKDTRQLKESLMRSKSKISLTRFALAKNLRELEGMGLIERYMRTKPSKIRLTQRGFLVL